CCITAGLEGITNTAAGETGSIRFLLCKLAAAKVFNSMAINHIHKYIVFFSSCSGKRLKPMGIVCNTALKSPFLHSHSHFISGLAVNRSTIFSSFLYGCQCGFVYVLAHGIFAENIFAKELRNLI